MEKDNFTIMIENLSENMDKLLADPESYIGLKPTGEQVTNRGTNQLTKHAIPICGEVHFVRICLNCLKPLEFSAKNANKNASNNNTRLYCCEGCGTAYRNRK